MRPGSIRVLIGTDQSSFVTWRAALVGLALGLAWVAGVLPAHAQAAGPQSLPGSSPGGVDALARARQKTAEELDALSEKIRLSQDRQESLEKDVARLRKDEITLRENLVATADKQRELSRRIKAAERRFVDLRDREVAIRQSLAKRRDVLGEVLAGLQRLGRNPPPALLVSADDALASVRSAILLGAVVPQMREETERLIADLRALSSVRSGIEQERQNLEMAHAQQAEQEERLSLLLEEKRKLQDERARELAQEREVAARLAEKATSLQELIGSLESEIASVREAAAEARRATQLREQQTEEQMARALESARNGELDAARIAPSVPFPALKGALRMPVEGVVAQPFGADDGTGNGLQGIMIDSGSGAVVQAPMDAWVVYAGPFRSYGQLLILNPGDGYHVVMAGMDRIHVAPGQFVVAGEPVAEMGETRLAGAAALALASSQPTLYIEFRKDGQPIDPAPWWAHNRSGRVSNDS